MNTQASPQKRLDEALTLIREKKFDAAVRAAEALVLSHPKAPESWCALASAYLAQNKPEAAEAGYAMALTLRPGDPELLYNRALCLQHSWRFAEAAQLYEKVLAHKPDHSNAWSNFGSASMWLQKFDQGIASLRRAIELDSNNENAHWNLALALLRVGAYEEGWREFEWRKQVFDHPMPKGREWSGEHEADTRLTIVAEQGLGDSIQFVRFVADARARVGTVELVVHDALIPLLAGQNIADELTPLSKMPKQAECWTRLMSLPLHTGREAKLGQPPYLRPETHRVDRWQKTLGQATRPRIGLAWQGSRSYRADHERSIPLAQFKPLFESIDAQYISLQRGFGSEQVENVRDHVQLTVFGEEFDKDGAFLDTAAVLSQLDAVVSSDTSLVHLAGALGVPTFVPLAWVPDWRWGVEPSTTTWYEHVQLFRQKEKGRWDTSFESLVPKLREVLR